MLIYGLLNPKLNNVSTTRFLSKRLGGFYVWFPKSLQHNTWNKGKVVMHYQSLINCISNLIQFNPRIPLPDELTVPASETVDNPLLHEGRIRSFRHERGNWASLLFVPLVFGIYEPHLESMISVLIRTCEESQLDFSSSSEFHISLSRTLILRLHWIQPLLDDLRKKLSGFTKFSMWLHGLAVYSNEEKTRTFLGVKVHQGRNEMLEIVNFTNDALEEYQLPLFYEDCSFHMSLGWCLGDKKEELSKLLPQLEGICNHYFDIESDMRTFEVDELFFKTGNRIHRVALKVT